ncbi:MAG TPA: cation:proton antiporter [Terriglobia bacterium]|nr:cation:proton antiporter [Terriglobia bacterium]
MAHNDLLLDLLILFGFATLIAVIVRRARQSAIVAYLLTGIVVGPSGLSLIANRGAIETMAEFGVALLLFTIGMEFSLSRIVAMRRLVLGAGGRQVVLTIAVVLGLTILANHDWRQGIYWGFLVAASSTAIVLKLLMEREEMETIHGRIIVGVLLFQDLCVVPMMAVLPALTAPPGKMVLAVVFALTKVIGAGALILFAARFFFPLLWSRIVEVRTSEIFIIAVIFFSLGTAWASASLGLSLALGAFIAGIALSETSYAYQIHAEVLPFRDSFNSLFFISIGMLLDLKFVHQHWAAVLGIAALIFVLKMLTGFSSVLSMGFTARKSLLAGLSLAQVGEFSFILLHQGERLNLVPAGEYQIFLAAAIITMMLTPAVVQLSPHIATHMPEMQRLRSIFPEPGEMELESQAAPLRDHVIICGYGLNGRMLARTLRRLGIEYLVLELDPAIVRQTTAEGESIFFGDSTKADILEKAGVSRARALVYAISDPFALPRAVATVRAMNPNLVTIVRTARVQHTSALEKAGASQVVASELSAAKEVIGRVLELYNVAEDKLDAARGAGRVANRLLDPE